MTIKEDPLNIDTVKNESDDNDCSKSDDNDCSESVDKITIDDNQGEHQDTGTQVNESVDNVLKVLIMIVLKVTLKMIH